MTEQEYVAFGDISMMFACTGKVFEHKGRNETEAVDHIYPLGSATALSASRDCRMDCHPVSSSIDEPMSAQNEVIRP